MLKKVVIKPGINREGTRYSSEGGWYECNNVRFAQGIPEKIGGWKRQSSNTFLGVCRSLFNWVTLSSQNLLGVGTNLKFYIERGTVFYDVTPIRRTVTLNNPFATVNASTTVTVTDAANGSKTGDFVTFSGAAVVAGLNLNSEFSITIVSNNTYTITAASAANATVAAGGGAAVVAAYQLNTGTIFVIPGLGWGAGGWGLGEWGIGGSATSSMQLWSQSNFGEDLVFAPRGGSLCYWDATGTTSTRGVLVTGMVGASDVPVIVNQILVSDINRFVFCFGCNEIGDTDLDPMLIRWSDQEDVVDWTPTATNQAGSLRLSSGSEIVAVIQARQEVLTWTNNALYSIQYVGAPEAWTAQLMGDNISVSGPNAVAYASGTVYWMGVDKFYKYDGSVQTLRCDVRRYVFSDFNHDQEFQVVAGTNEAFDEVWWWYCSAGETAIDSYVVYNYANDIWYYGSMARTAWVDSTARNFPTAATYSNNLVEHENGVDDGVTSPAVALPASITSAQFDLDDGHTFAFVSRVLPDITFTNSTAVSPAGILSLLPLQNSGSGYTTPASVGGDDGGTITRIAVLPIEEFTGQIFTRVRGRQMSLQFASTALGVTWQLGNQRLDFRPDGRR